jgi:expansin (peptidoglycan-binding protein)
MTLDQTTFDAMLKDHYADGMVEQIGYSDNPALALFRKSMGSRSVGGRKWIQPVGTRIVNRGSSTFAIANAATSNESRHDAFEPTRAKHYRVARIDNETIEATAGGDIDAFEPALDETEKAIEAESNWANFRIYRSRGGAIGRMTNTAFATTVMTMDDPASLWAISDGDVVRLSANDGTTGALKAGSLTVASIQHAQSGGVATITYTAQIGTGITGPAANDYVFLEGDFGLAPAGFADYVPDTDAAAATTLFGFDRSVNNMMGGQRVNAQGSTVSEAIIDMVTAYVNGNNGKKKGGRVVLFMHTFTFGTLSKQTEGKWVMMSSVNYNGAKNATLGIEAFQIRQAGIEVNIVVDRMCPTTRMYMCDVDSWTMFHAGSFPAFLTKKHGNILKVSENADAWECRVGGYLNYVTKKPFANVVAILA